MMVGYKIYLEELFSGYESYWTKTFSTKFYEVITGKSCFDINTFSEKEYKDTLNSAFLKGPFELRKVLMPAEMMNFLEDIRKMMQEIYPQEVLDELLSYDAEKMLSIDLSLDTESIITIMSDYGLLGTQKIAGMSANDFQNKFKNNVFKLWVEVSYPDKRMIEKIVKEKYDKLFEKNI